MFDKFVKSTVSSLVIDQIKQLLADGQLQPGDRLPSERQLAEMLGVSRPSLREAIRALEYGSVLETRVGEGVFVSCSSAFLENTMQAVHLAKQFELEEMLTARRAIEITAIKLAVARASDDDMEVLRKLCDDAEARIDDLEAFIRYDYDFHAAIAEASGNNVLITLLQAMRSLMRAYNAELLQAKEWRSKVIAMHRAVVDKLSTRNVQSAIDAMEAHFDNIVRQMEERSTMV
jgi:GntR family transcriptional repressor for pyruvate dehydrogenase complex